MKKSAYKYYSNANRECLAERNKEIYRLSKEGISKNVIGV